jgi:hypothetical protein
MTTIKKDLKLTTDDVSNSNVLALTATYVFNLVSHVYGVNKISVSLFEHFVDQLVIDGALERCLPAFY